MAGVFLSACEERAAAPVPAPAPQAVQPAPKPEPAPYTPPPVPDAPRRPVVVVLDYDFPIPAGWVEAKPANSMRLAELHVPHSSNDPTMLCTVVFSTAGGDVQANIDRWSAQVRDPQGQPVPATTEIQSVRGFTIHTAEATGTYVGMNEAPRGDWTLRGAIIETPRGLLFIKMTGPSQPMMAAAPGFTELIEGIMTH